MSERTPMQPVHGLTKSQRPSVADVPAPPARRAHTQESGQQTPTVAAAPSAGEGETAPNTPRKIRVAKPSDTSGGTRDATFTTPLALREILRERARITKDLTIPGIVLEAVETHLQDLARLVDLEKGTAPAGTSLFPDPTSSPRSSETGETRVPVTMRLTAANLAVLDNLVRQTGADNRSQLITAALRAHLR